MVRGEVYFVELKPRSGSEQAGIRPCILVTRDNFNRNSAWQSLTVVPITSAVRWRRPSLTTVSFEAGEAGLTQACTAIAHQITTVDRSKFVLPALGKLSEQKMAALELAIRNYLALG